MQSIAFGLVRKMNHGMSVDRALKVSSCIVPLTGGADVLSTFGLDKFNFGYPIRHIDTRDIVLVEFFLLIKKG